MTTAVRDHTAADAFLRRSHGAIERFTQGLRPVAVTPEALESLLRTAFLQGWHEAMVARDEAPDSCDLPFRPGLPRQ